MWLTERVKVLCCAVLSCVWLFVTPWTVARQSPLSMGFSRQEYWSGFPFPPPKVLWAPGKWGVIFVSLWSLLCDSVRCYLRTGHVQWLFLWVSSLIFLQILWWDCCFYFQRKRKNFSWTWQGAEILAEHTPAHHIEIDIQLRTSLLFKTEELWGAGGQEVVLLASCMQAFGLASVPLQSPSFLLLADPKWFRITGRSRIFFSPKQSITGNANTQNYLIHLWWQRIQLFALGLSPQRVGLAGGQGQLWLLNFNQQFQWQYWIKKLLATS